MNSHTPEAGHYNYSYLGEDFCRLFSYQHQLNTLKVPAPASVLLIGKGDGFVSATLADMGYSIDTLDVADDLGPSHVGDVRAMPFEDGSYDIVFCCQVLEHIPFSDVPKAVGEISRIARKQIIISVPDQRRFLSFDLKVFRFRFTGQLSIPRFRPTPIPEQRYKEMGHFWEVGYRDYPGNKVITALTPEGWNRDVQRVIGMPWHLFICLDRKSAVAS